jgi:IclR family transcriptional regulator, pca regulon regulatory protein
MSLSSDTWTDATHWPSGSDTFVEAFAKGLAVIAAFNGERSLTLSDAARRANLPRAGTRRMLHTLVALGIAQQVEDNFVLTPRVLQLGFSYLSSLSLREIAQPVIEKLSREADEVVAISVLDGADVVYITRAEVTSVLRRSLTVGSRIPAFCTSMGRVLLAGLPPEQCAERLVNAERRAWTKLTTTDPLKLEREIAKVREQGWSVTVEELEIGAFGIAAPIKNRSGTTIAAINLSTNLARHSPKALVKNFLTRLQTAADQISQHLPA